MKIQLLLFASVREECDTSSIEVEMKEEASWTAFFTNVKTQIPSLPAAASHCMLAVDEQYVDGGKSVLAALGSENDSDLHATIEKAGLPDISSVREVAIIPPVSGG